MNLEYAERKTIQDMIDAKDGYGIANYLVNKFFNDLIESTNEQSVNEAFDSIGLNRNNIENSCIRINELINPIKPEQLGHKISKKIIYRSILVSLWEQEIKDNLEDLCLY